MGLADTPPRGGLIEVFDGVPRVLLLRMAEIERFEDKHGGIFALYDGMMGRGAAPTTAQVLDLLALGLVGGGLPEAAADRVVRIGLPSALPRLRAVAAGLIGVTFYPDVEAADDDAAGGDDPPEKTTGGGSTSDGSSGVSSPTGTGRSRSGR